jgi:uncharacterized membrane protein YphA (DoxX/SURF4 family)
MNRFLQIKQWLKEHPDLFLDLVRIYIGTGLFVKAVYLMNHREYLNGIIEQAGPWMFAPVVVAHYVIAAHLAGGVLLALGLITRIAALANIPVLIGAVFYVYMPKMMTLEPRQNLEFSALVLFLLGLLVVYGGGRVSLDHALEKKLAMSSQATDATRATSR